VPPPRLPRAIRAPRDTVVPAYPGHRDPIPTQALEAGYAAHRTEHDGRRDCACPTCNRYETAVNRGEAT
jgi:hypothetical protein